MKIGHGQFSWPGYERITDRYGSFTLFGPCEAEGFALKAIHQVEGKRVTITCKVEETRESSHIGDIFRGIFPTTPEVGEEICLGTGTLWVDSVDDHTAVGLVPDDGRETDWMDPHLLYRLHEQTVTVTVEPASDPQPG